MEEDIMRKRHNYTPEEKVSILKRHLVDKILVSDLCDQYELSPTVFYRWQKQFFENGHTAFINNKRKSKLTLQERRIQELEEKLATKNEVISELMEAHLKLKKTFGEV
jgi:transposase-like protein